MNHYFFTSEQLRDRTRLAFCGGLIAGAAIGVFGAAAADRLDASNRPSISIGAPRTERHDAMRTVATIPLRFGAHAVTCTLTIERARGAWSFTC